MDSVKEQGAEWALRTHLRRLWSEMMSRPARRTTAREAGLDALSPRDLADIGLAPRGITVPIRADRCP